MTTSTSVAPSARARSRPSRSPRYSATLLVVSPRRRLDSSSTPGALTTAAAAAGPGLPRAPPSVWTMTRTRLLDRGERREVARDPRTPAVAHLALAAAGGPGQAALLLAAVDDDRDVGVVVVVVGELLVELVGERLGNHAVDHDRDPSSRRRDPNSV